MPSRVSGHFTTMFLWILASLRPSEIIAVGFGGDHLGADVAVDDVADHAHLLLDRTAFLGDQRRVGGHAVDDAPARALLQLIQVRGIQKNFTLLPSRLILSFQFSTGPVRNAESVMPRRCRHRITIR